MPAHLGDIRSHRDFLVRGPAAPTGFDDSVTRCLHIGLVNNMPDGALEATERQFLRLLDSASNGIAVRLSLFSLPEVPRGEAGRLHINRFYSGIESLSGSHLDGLIVTGAEPLAAKLTDEPYWRSLTTVLDWSEQNTHSTVLSCLAAHAAVQHIDGIGRRRLADKRHGLLECVPASDHQLTDGIPTPYRMPHSRWNDLPEDELTDRGYTVLARIQGGGADIFVKNRQSLFVFFQGHPEYDSNSLLLEYRRDVGRYLRGESDLYPALPDGYFDPETVKVLSDLRHQAQSGRDIGLLEGFPTVQAEKTVTSTWSLVATTIYGNWLKYLFEAKKLSSKKDMHRTRVRKESAIPMPARAAIALERRIKA